MMMLQTTGHRLKKLRSSLTGNFSRVGGFTLIETILALVLTGILLSALSIISSGWLKRWDAGTRRAQDVETLVLTANRIADDIRSAVVLPATSIHPIPLFRGLEQQLTLIREAGRPGVKGLEFVGLLASRKGGLGRVRGSASSITSLKDVLSKEETSLLPQEFVVMFAYSGSDMIWHGNWTEDRLPSKVQVTISRQTDLPNTAWIFVVPVRTTLPASCAAAGTFSDCELLASGHQSETPTSEVSPPKLPKVRNPDAGELP